MVETVLARIIVASLFKPGRLCGVIVDVVGAAGAVEAARRLRSKARVLSLLGLYVDVLVSVSLIETVWMFFKVVFDVMLIVY